MDNSFWLKKKVAKLYKKIKFKIDYHSFSILTSQEGNNRIYDLLDQNVPVLIGRFGATEMRCVDEYLKNGSFSNKIKEEVHTLSGVFPPTDEVLTKFCELYISCAKEIDLLALWGVGAESKIVKSNNLKCGFTHLRSLEPYYYENPWSKILAQKNVLIIHPFTDSISEQYSKHDKIFKNKNILPEFKSIILIKAVQSNAGGCSVFSTWFDALDHMKSEVDKVEFDIAIVGAGAYGLPLSAYIKSLGKQVIQMAGSTQLLFGIKGNRWDAHPIISQLYNEHWVRPSIIETPPQAERVEGGSYW